MKNSIKPYLSKFVWYLIWFEGALMISAFISGFPQMFLKATLNYSTLTERIVYGILLTVVPMLIFFGPVSKMGHKSGNFEIPKIIIPALAVFVILQLLSTPLHNAIYITGGAGFFAKAIHFGNSQITAADEEQINNLTQIIMALTNLFINLPVIIASEYLGVKRRSRERKEMGFNGK